MLTPMTALGCGSCGRRRGRGRGRSQIRVLLGRTAVIFFVSLLLYLFQLFWGYFCSRRSVISQRASPPIFILCNHLWSEMLAGRLPLYVYTFGLILFWEYFIQNEKSSVFVQQYLHTTQV